MAEALAWPFLVKPIRYGPFARLPNRLLGASLIGLTEAARAALAPPWPELVIAAGRRTAPVARWLKRRAPDAFLVQLMWPGSARGLDLLAVPAHDDLAAERPEVIRTVGVPHRVTRERLAAAARELAPRLGDLPRPRIACLVGGSNRAVRFRPSDALRLAHEASALAGARGGSLLVSTSRRTGEACTAALAARDRRAAAAASLVARYRPDRQSLSRPARRGRRDHRDRGTRPRCAARPARAAGRCSCSAPRAAPPPSSPACTQRSRRPAICGRSAPPGPSVVRRRSTRPRVVADAIRARLARPIGAGDRQAVASAAETP